MNQQYLQAVEADIKRNKASVNDGEAVARLMSNKDFKKIILQGYFKDEAVRLVHLKADPAMQSEESQRSIVLQMDAIGSFHQYLHIITQLANIAEKNLVTNELMREELLAGEDE